MSKDIRSFFKLQPSLKLKTKPAEESKKKSTKALISDDEEIIPESPNFEKNKKEKRQNKKRRIIEDSSDEEQPSKIKEKVSKKNHNKKQNKESLKEVSAADIFGSGPIKRTAVPRKKDVDKPKEQSEVTIHSDEDFEKTIVQIDESENCTATNCLSKTAVELTAHGTDDVSSNEKSKYFTNKTEIDSLLSVKHEENKGQNTISNYKIPKKPKLHNEPLETEKKSTIKTEKSYEHQSSSPRKIQNSPKKEKSPIKNKKQYPVKEDNVKKTEIKRDFSEFLDLGCENDINKAENKEDEATTSKSKKRKCDQSLNESVLSDEERFERKRHSAQLYQSYLNRTGPKNLGAKEIPHGAPNCFENLSFVLTGVLESFERDEIAEAISKYGGVVKSGVSKKVTHIVAGDDAGPAKLAKAKDLGIEILNEDQFLNLIKQKSDPSKQVIIKDENAKKEVALSKKFKSDDRASKKPKRENGIKDDKGSDKTEKSNNKRETIKENGFGASSFYKNRKEDCSATIIVDEPKPCTSTDSGVLMEASQSSKEAKSSCSVSSTSSLRIDNSGLLWVDKYKPRNLKQIIGQNGDSSIVKKLANWLSRWYLNRSKKIDKPSPWAKNDDGAYFKCALLSGPPGIGKTTTVSLVCADMGFDVVEFNASDTRSKNLIKDQISELLTTTSLAGFVSNESGKRALTKKHVLVMDEVDGMAGNEDRGGMQELISLIKLTSVPIICMCNDRNSPKIRSLVNYCYDLKFSRPRVDQIKSAMMSVCFKEGVKVSGETLTQLIVAANQDVRQTLNLLSMYSAGGDGQVTVKKDVKLGPWEVVRKVFSEEEQKSMSIHDKSDLFFYDYSIAPLFVQENYLHVVPNCPKEEVLKCVSRAADSISLGDLVEAKIRSRGSWNLLPVQAILSSVVPGHAMRGRVGGQIQFPAWLGKNSRAGKMRRLAQEIHAHTRLSTSGSKSSIFLDYCQHLRDAIVQPLVRDKMEGIPRSLDVLQSYRLLREDLESLTELAAWPGKAGPMLHVDSKVKAAMTRAYNKEAATLPYAQAALKKARAAPPADEDVLPDPDEEGDGVLSEQDSDSDPDHDAMIKKKKKTPQSNKETEKGEKKKGKKNKK